MRATDPTNSRPAPGCHQCGQRNCDCIDPDDPFPDLVESVCINVCGRDEGRDAHFVAWLRKFLTAKLASAQAEHAAWRTRAESAESQLAAKGEELERKLAAWIRRENYTGSQEADEIAAEARRIVEGGK